MKKRLNIIHDVCCCSYLLGCYTVASVRMSINTSVFRPHCTTTYIHRVSKNVPPLACYNFDTHEWMLIFFGRNITEEVGNQTRLHYAILYTLCFCTTWRNGETRNRYTWLPLLCLTPRRRGSPGRDDLREFSVDVNGWPRYLMA